MLPSMALGCFSDLLRLKAWLDCRTSGGVDPWNLSVTTTADRIAIFQSPGTLLLPKKSPPEPGQYQFGGESNFTSIITLSLVTEGFRWKNATKTAAQLIPLSITASAVLFVRTTGHRERPLTDAARRGTCPPTSTRWAALLSSSILYSDTGRGVL